MSLFGGVRRTALRLGVLLVLAVGLTACDSAPAEDDFSRARGTVQEVSGLETLSRDAVAKALDVPLEVAPDDDGSGTTFRATGDVGQFTNVVLLEQSEQHEVGAVLLTVRAGVTLSYARFVQEKIIDPATKATPSEGDVAPDESWYVVPAGVGQTVTYRFGGDRLVTVSIARRAT